jgi:hypothetical protein
VTPTRPGLYRVRYPGNRIVEYPVDLGRDGHGRACLVVLDESGNVRDTLETFTAILGSVGGEWVS